MRLRISHSTTYAYDEPIQYGLQQLRLTPKLRQSQDIEEWNISLQGGHVEVEFDDHHNNRVLLIGVDAQASELVVTASGIINTKDTSGIMGTHGGFTPLWLFCRPTTLTMPGKGIRQLVKTIDQSEKDDVLRLHELSSKIADQVQYETGTTHTGTTAENALENAKGVCQDHAHIFISAARLMGFPSRYVSGYLMLNDRVEQDATHAWVEAHVADLGWVGFDVSNGISPDERYVPVATGLDYLEAAPISGMRFGDSEESMIVSLQVQQ